MISNIEHLLENAIVAIEEDRDYKWQPDQYVQKVMLPYVKASTEEIWTMAIYATITYREAITSCLIDKYGYSTCEQCILNKR